MHQTDPIPAASSASSDSSPTSCGRRAIVIAVGILLLLVLAVHGRDVRGKFVDWDDPFLVSTNPLLNPPTSASLKEFWARGYDGLYTPLAYTLWAGVAHVGPRAANGELQPAAFHALNLLLHAAAVVLVFFLLRRWMRMIARPREIESGTGTLTFPALIGAALFAVHPLQVEPVAWVSGMNNLLAGALSIACIIAYLRLLDPAARFRAASYAAAFFLLAAAMFSKPTAIATPLLLVVIDRAIARDSWARALLRIAPMALLAIPFILAGRAIQPASDLPNLPLIPRVIVAGDAIGFYTAKLACPIALCMDYGRSPQRVLDSGGSIGNWIALTTLIAILALAGRRWPAITCAIAVFITAPILVLGFVSFSYQNYSTVADRYAYVAMLGPAMMIAAILRRWPRRSIRVAAIALILVAAVVSFRQSAVWADSFTLGNRAIAVNPQSLGAHAMLGHSYAAAGDVDRAELENRAALQIAPNDADVHFNLGSLLLTRDPREALSHFSSAAAAGYDKPELYRNSGLAWMQLHEPQHALDCFAIARQNGLDGDPLVNEQAGIAYDELGQFDAAAERFSAALQASPRSGQLAMQCARALFAAGRYGEADAAAQRALQLDPASAAASQLRAQIAARRQGDR